jgi:hypothetical protein
VSASYTGLVLMSNEPYLLSVAGYCPISQFSFCTQMLIDAFLDEDWFDGRVTKDNSSSKEAVYNRDGYLNCIVSVAGRGEMESRVISCTANSPILLPFDTSSRVNVEDTLGFFCISGTQSLTGLKLILLCETDVRPPSLSICSPSMELTRLSDIVMRPLR